MMNIQKVLIPQPISIIRGVLNVGLGLMVQFSLGKNWVLIAVILLFAFGHMAIGAYLKIYNPSKFDEVNYPYTKKEHWREGFVAGGVCLLSAVIIALGFLGYLFLIPGIKDQVFSSPNPQAVIDSWSPVLFSCFVLVAIYVYHWGRLLFYKEKPAPVSRIKLRNRKNR